MESQYCDKNGNIIDYYTIFNLPYDAGTEEIKSAFRSLVKRYHPDTSRDNSGELLKKLDFIIRGYRILTDSASREKYDKLLFDKIKPARNNYLIIPKKRIKYSASLSEMLKARYLPKKIKRKDIIKNFAQDIEIFISSIEAKKGALAYIELPARMTCPLCTGSNPECHVCRGVGRIHTSAQLEVEIPPRIADGTRIDVDLTKLKPDRLTRFHGRSIRIRITVMPSPHNPNLP
ncbi:MAG: DnaJ domain-containing protein [bacterium]|nr:DnaJ domain-containing protein [bacterium]